MATIKRLFVALVSYRTIYLNLECNNNVLSLDENVRFELRVGLRQNNGGFNRGKSCTILLFEVEYLVFGSYI